jgi:hypothetical protein
MKLPMREVLICLFLSGICIGQTQTPPKSEMSNKTEGACSNIIPDNHGTITITCTGFSVQQSKEIEKLLHGIAKSETKDRDLILQKLDEVLAEVRKSQEQNQQRTITDEQFQYMRRDYNGGVDEFVHIFAPSGDEEASHLALRIAEILGKLGFYVSPVNYRTPLPKLTDVDVAIFSNYGAQDGAEFIGGILDHLASLQVKFIQWNDVVPENDSSGKYPPPRDRKVPIHVYVFPRTREQTSTKTTQSN